MDFLLLFVFMILIDSLVIYRITKYSKDKTYNDVIKKIKMNYLYLIYGDKAKYDKKFFPILIGILILLVVLLNIFMYNSNINIYKLIVEISFETIIILLLIIFWKNLNIEIDVYICKEGIGFKNVFVKWDEFEGYSKKDNFIILKRKLKPQIIQKLSTSKNIYLNKDVEDIIKNFLPKK
ncbi:hypothetical protein [Methanocaldococcus sp.]